LKTLHISFTTIIICCLLFFIPFESHSDNLDDLKTLEMVVPDLQTLEIKRANSPDVHFISGFNFVSANIQYQIRDNSGGLICIVQSDNITVYDDKITFDYLYNHPSRSTFENNGSLFNYVLIKESWNVGGVDTFLSAVRHMLIDPDTENHHTIFFGTTNGCAIQPTDKVTVLWEVVFG